MSNLILEGLKVIGGLAPDSDIYEGGPNSTDVVSLAEYERVVFALYQKTGGSNTGTATVTVEACDNFTPSNTTAIAFTYYKNESAGSADAFTKATATTSGFVTTANKTSIYLVEVKASDLIASGYPNVRMKLTEAVDDIVIGSVLILAGQGPKRAVASLDTAIA